MASHSDNLQTEKCSSSDSPEDPSFQQSNEGTLECMFCPANFPSNQDDAEDHFNLHGDLLFECSICPGESEYFLRLRDIQEHQNQFHQPKLFSFKNVLLPTDLRTMRCKECNKCIFARDAKFMKTHLDFEHDISELPEDLSDKVELGCRVCCFQTSDFTTWKHHFRAKYFSRCNALKSFEDKADLDTVETRVADLIRGIRKEQQIKQKKVQHRQGICDTTEGVTKLLRKELGIQEKILKCHICHHYYSGGMATHYQSEEHRQGVLKKREESMNRGASRRHTFGTKLSTKLSTRKTAKKSKEPVLSCKLCQINNITGYAPLAQHIMGQKHMSMAERKNYFQCDICDLAFIDLADLKAHLKTKEHNYLTAQLQLYLFTEDERFCSCRLCKVEMPRRDFQAVVTHFNSDGHRTKVPQPSQAPRYLQLQDCPPEGFNCRICGVTKMTCTVTYDTHLRGNRHRNKAILHKDFDCRLCKAQCKNIQGFEKHLNMEGHLRTVRRKR